MKGKWRSRLACVLLAALMLAGCAGGKEQAKNAAAVKQTQIAADPVLRSKEALPVPRIETEEDEEGRRMFSLSVEEFIWRYNALYRQEKGVDYLTPVERWNCYDSSAFGMVCYQFSENEKAWSLPTITVYTTSRGIRQVTVDFDEHSRTESLYALYEKMCGYTLRVFLPELEADGAAELTQQVNRVAYEDVRPNEEGYGPEALPSVLYYKDGVGIYPYFAVGEWVHLCVIPVTQEAIRELESKGVTVYALED